MMKIPMIHADGAISDMDIRYLEPRLKLPSKKKVSTRVEHWSLGVKIVDTLDVDNYDLKDYHFNIDNYRKVSVNIYVSNKFDTELCYADREKRILNFINKNAGWFFSYGVRV